MLKVNNRNRLGHNPLVLDHNRLDLGHIHLAFEVAADHIRPAFEAAAADHIHPAASEVAADRNRLAFVVAAADHIRVVLEEEGEVRKPWRRGLVLENWLGSQWWVVLVLELIVLVSFLFLSQPYTRKRIRSLQYNRRRVQGHR